MKSLEENYVPAKIEEKVLNSWKKNEIFQKSVDQRPKDNSYSFYDGPPFITGLPHYGHLLGSIVKDVIPRFQTMKGKRVERVWGWDCHGLPAENKVEKELGINSKREIETLGVDKFVAACKNYVNNVSEEWEWYIDHIGRWVDFRNAYKTMDLSYMESVMWVFKQLFDIKLIYKGKRVSLFCPRCSTPISNFEVAMDNSYKEVTDPSVIIKFKLKDKDEYLLAWTTTPWTLPSNFALAINPKLDYAKVNSAGQKFVVAEKLVKKIFGNKANIVESFPGTKLVKLAYEPLYSYYQSNENDYKIYPAEFVEAQDGTGIVHIAPGFGEDDTNLGKDFGLTMADSVNEEGHLDSAIKVAAGKYFKAADKLIVADLKTRGLLYKEDKITHSYPHCHRCGTPLLYKAQEAWYIDISFLRNQLLKTNEPINWVPKHFKHGRFELGIENAPDWCISRTRYWGAPIPVWECDKCDWRFVAGSINDIEEISGKKITDLHRPEIDEITFKCQQCDGIAHRVKEVLDSWVEAASMPYAQRHYPFENEAEFKANFPADFITEYTGQLRAWFYVMHVISNALFATHSFKNVIVTGVIMGNDGRKMSKNYGNYPDPKESIVKYGADSLRLYLMGSPIVMGEDISISETEWQEQLRSTINILWNSYKFFANNAAVDKQDYKDEVPQSKNELDMWILSRLEQVVTKINEYLSAYTIPGAVRELQSFVQDLSTWYIRESRVRIGATAPNNTDKSEAYSTMMFVFCNFFKASAPLIPFISEYLFQHLTGKLSVHLEMWPKISGFKNEQLEVNTQGYRNAASNKHSFRKENKIPVKKTLISTATTYPGTINVQPWGTELLSRETNELYPLVYPGKTLGTVAYGTPEYEQVVRQYDPNPEETLLKVNQLAKIYTEEKLEDMYRAREIIRSIQQARKDAGCRLDEEVIVELPEWPTSQETEIKQKALVKELRKGETLKIIKG